MSTILKQLAEAAETVKEEAHSLDPGQGRAGWILILEDDNPITKKLAKVLGVKDGWDLTPVGGMFAAYNSGDRLSIFEKKEDYEPDEG